MLGIYARSFMTATRTDTGVRPGHRDRATPRRRRWLPAGHWWLSRDSDPDRR